MEVRVLTMRKMLEALSKKTGKPLDYPGLNQISEGIKGIGDDYLYQKVLQKIKNENDDVEISFRTSYINSILKFLSYSSLENFENSLEVQIDNQLLSLVGGYYNYVRANHQQGIVLRSPVRIYEAEGRVFFELKGNDHLFKGELQLRGACLTVLMESAMGKCFHHVYKIGPRNSPKVLQGVFSGMSTSLEVIGGRTVLIRQAVPFEKLTNRKEVVEVLVGSESLEDSRIANYFKEYSGNNLRPNTSIDFGYDDLVNS